jgi:hypothetical protein
MTFLGTPGARARTIVDLGDLRPVKYRFWRLYNYVTTKGQHTWLGFGHKFYILKTGADQSSVKVHDIWSELEAYINNHKKSKNQTKR